MAERKKYIETEIPILKSNMRILGTAEELDKKTIKLDLTRKLRGKGLTIKFRIFNKEGKLIAIPNQIELVSSYIKRMMRKRTDYVEDSFIGQCKDIRIKIKPFLITRKKVSRAVKKKLRNTTREFILEYIKEREYNELCNELLNGNLQKEMLPKLKKVYPLSFCDIRVFETKELEKIDIEKASQKEEKEVEEDIQEEIKEEVEESEKKEEIEEKKTNKD